MNPLRLVVVLSTGTLLLAGCSNAPSEPKRYAMDPTSASAVTAPTPDPDRWENPRLTVVTRGWRSETRQGIFADAIDHLGVTAGESVELRWIAHATSRPGGKIIGFRWSLDNPDITDETPRLNENDLAHWSPWSATEKSVVLGPFDSGPHRFYVETRDNVGLVTLATVELQVDEAPVRQAGQP